MGGGNNQAANYQQAPNQPVYMQGSNQAQSPQVVYMQSQNEPQIQYVHTGGGGGSNAYAQSNKNKDDSDEAKKTQAEEPEENLIDLDKITSRVTNSTQKKVNELVEQYPDETVSVIRNWLYESK